LRSILSNTPSAAFARNPRAAFTLLEILLALAVSVVLLAAVAAAIDLYRRMTLAGQDQVGEARLVRAVLHKIEIDIRSLVPPQTQVTSPYDSSVSGSSSGSPSGTNGSTKPTTTNSSNTSSSGGSSSSSSGSSSGTTSTSQQTAMMDPLQNVYAQTVFGLYGDQRTLVLNTLCARRPSVQPSDPNAPQTSSGTHGDLKTVAYFLSAGQTSAPTAPGAATTGLARLEGDHVAVGYAMLQSGSLASQAKVIAPEVTMINFRYFDGTQWLNSWDASFLQALPAAIEVTITVRAADPNNPTAPSDPSAAVTLRQYRHVVAVSTMAQPMPISELATLPEEEVP
jgi:hypothetical protein